MMVEDAVSPMVPLDTSEYAVSNFDGVVNEGVAQQLIDNPGTYADYPGWNFHARVWHKGGKWYGQPWCHHVAQGIHEADTLEELRDSISDEYGYD